MDDEALQAVLEKIQAGRTRDLTCPFCGGGTLEKKASDYGARFVCPSCKKYIEAPDDGF